MDKAKIVKLISKCSISIIREELKHFMERNWKGRKEFG